MVEKEKWYNLSIKKRDGNGDLKVEACCEWPAPLPETMVRS